MGIPDLRHPFYLPFVGLDLRAVWILRLFRLLAGSVALLGIGLFAIPTGILGAAFLEDQQRHGTHRKCPHCGEEIE